MIAPHRQTLEIGAVDTVRDPQIENRKFNDFTKAYIPEITEHLTADRSGWLSLWTDQNEFGRPIYQISGFSPAYFLSWFIAQITNDPWQFITVLSLFTSTISGIFIILFCREVGLHPIAALIAGISFSASPLFMYWLTFPMFLAARSWSAGALWAVSRIARKSDLLGWSVLAFCGYSLLMTAYPQTIVFHIYILGGYSLYLLWHKLKVGVKEATTFIGLIFSGLLVGAILAFPAYRDLFILSSESARVSPDPAFFTTGLPKFSTFLDIVQFFVLNTVPELLGNPIESSFPFPYSGLNMTLITVFFVLFGMLSSFKKAWIWWLVVGVLCVFAFSHSLYIFAVKNLGFNLSRSNPLGSILLPITVLMAYGIHAFVTRLNSSERSFAVIFSVVMCFLIILIGLAFGIGSDLPIRWGMVLAMLIVLALLAFQCHRAQLVFLIGALVITMAMTSYPLLLRQTPENIAITSPLVEKLRANLSEGARFAVVSPNISLIGPNFNASLGLSSVHSYNSLSSKRYHHLIEELGGKVRSYGRWSTLISPDYSSVIFWMSNIALILSSTELSHENLAFLDKESEIYLYKVNSRMGESLQVFSEQVGDEKIIIPDPRFLDTFSPIKRLDETDRLEFETRSGLPSIFLLSQKFHRDWQAKVFTNTGWEVASLTEVNGVFQGVYLPSNTQRVRLEFRPFSRYMWIGHVFWCFMFVLLGVTCWRKYNKA